jgi:hypothetical protein
MRTIMVPHADGRASERGEVTAEQQQQIALRLIVSQMGFSSPLFLSPSTPSNWCGGLIFLFCFAATLGVKIFACTLRDAALAKELKEEKGATDDRARVHATMDDAGDVPYAPAGRLLLPYGTMPNQALAAIRRQENLANTEQRRAMCNNAYKHAQGRVHAMMQSQLKHRCVHACMPMEGGRKQVPGKGRVQRVAVKPQTDTVQAP